MKAKKPKAKAKTGLTQADFRRLALALPEALESPHFENTSFRVKGKIFGTMGEGTGRGVVKLTAEHQEMLIAAEPKVFESVPSWGKYGWTYVHLKFADEEMVRGVLLASWRNVAPKKLVAAQGGASATPRR